MENRRRIGNDYTFTWPFEVRTGEQTTEPYDLTGRVFQLYMVGQLETIEIPADEIEVDGNEITWTWHGKDQRYPGLYNAKLVENGGEDGMITVDVKYAVTLVPHTWQEAGTDDGCISLESVELVATEVSMTPGPRGPQGEQGPAGPQGETGPAGPQGAPGTAGPQGPEGKSAYEVAVDNGFEGTEEEWLESLHGGPRGPQGYSAYEVAVNEGYVGTETQWLASLKGETGATGATGPQGPQGVQGATGPQGPTGATGAQGQQGETGPQGPQGETGATGAQGPEGKSAYQVAVDNGYSGTEVQWLASLKGETGATGPQGPQGETGATGATGPQGETGATGPQGPKGDTGDPGITSASVSVDANTGTPSVDASITNKVLTLAFHNLKGETGATGATGETGATGPAGERGGKWLEIASTPTAYTTQVGDFLPSYRVSKSAVLTQAGVDDVIVGDILVNSYYVYGVGYVDDDYVYTTARSSIRGATGGTGSAATIAVGTVTTGEAGSQAAVNNRGSSSAAVFDFTIPKGDKGDTGETGAKGDKGDKGDTGDPGITSATVSVDASTGTPSAQASITNKILALAFSGLKGETGPQGATGASGAAGADGVGIASVVQTVESTTPGGTNEITITKTDGTSSTVNVRNGDGVGTVAIVQDTGNSTTAAMSQDGTTKAIQAVSDELGWAARTVELTPSDYANVIWGGDKWYAANANFNGYVAKVHAGATVTVTATPSTKGRIMLFADKPEVGVSTPSGSYLDVGGGMSYTVPFSFTVPEGKEWLFFGVTLSSTTKDAAYSETGGGLLQMYKEFTDSGVSPQTIEENSDRIDDLYTKTGWTDVEEWSVAAWGATNYYITTDFSLPIRFTYWTDNPASDMSGSSHKEMRLSEYNGDTFIANHTFYLDETRQTDGTFQITVASFNSATTRILVYGATAVGSAVNYRMTMEHIGTLNAELETRIESTGLRDYSELKCVCLGDSITESLGSATTYPDYLHNISKMDVYGCGFGGSDWAQRAEQSATPTLANAYAAFDLVNLVKSWCDNDFTYVDAAQAFLVSSQGDDNSAQIARLKAQSVANTDLVIIMSGVNDFTRNKVLGDADSTSKNEVSGAINLVVQYLLTANPNLIIYFANNKRYYNNGNFTDAGLSDNITNGQGLHLSDYNECIARQAAKWNIPICDVHDSLGWNKYNHSVYFANDGAHCTSKGYEIIARKIWSFIKANEIF